MKDNKRRKKAKQSEASKHASLQILRQAIPGAYLHPQHGHLTRLGYAPKDKRLGP